MNEQVKGQIRHALTTIGGIIAGAGYISEGVVPELVGAIMVIAGAVWSWRKNRGL